MLQPNLGIIFEKSCTGLNCLCLDRLFSLLFSSRFLWTVQPMDVFREMFVMEYRARHLFVTQLLG